MTNLCFGLPFLPDMQRWYEMASSVPGWRSERELLQMRDCVAQLRLRFPEAYARSTAGEFYEHVRRNVDYAYELAGTLMAYRILYEAAELASRPNVIVCSIGSYFDASQHSASHNSGPVELGSLSVRLIGDLPLLYRMITDDGRQVLPCSFHADVFDRLKPEGLCCECGCVTRSASLCRCGAHVMCDAEECIAACDVKCEASLRHRAEICAKLKKCEAWPFTFAGFRSEGEDCVVPVPLAQMLRDGGMCYMPSFVTMHLDEADTFLFITHAPLIGAELQTATLRAAVCSSRRFKGGRAERRFTRRVS